jgi:penicillin-binding protein 1A
MVFHNEDGTPYIPLNFRGEWNGSVLLYNALAQSMNIPSLKVLDTIGFDAAINRAAALLDITNPNQIRRTFPRVYPLGLGIISTSPLRLARAFAVFGNQGRSVTPIAIRMVEDRNGRIVLDPERELRLQQKRSNNQVVSPQNAYVMNRILQKTVEVGSLRSGSGYGDKFTFIDENGKSFRMPVAGKTGTTQNWADAWAVGYSTYYTTAVWFGFDRPGNSLGVELTGATLSGQIWGNYMREIHQGLPRKDFARPASGVVDVTVCAKSGLLRTAFCNEGAVTLPFLSGTSPGHECNIHSNTPWTATTAYDNMLGGTWGMDDFLIGSLSLPVPPEDLFPGAQNQNNRNRNTGTRNPPPSNPYSSWGDTNPFLDGDDGYRYTEPEVRAGENIFSVIPETPPPFEEPEPQTTERQPEIQQTERLQDADDNPNNSDSYETAVHGPEIPTYNPFLD